MDRLPSERMDSWNDLDPAVRAALAVASLGAAGIHFAVIGEHFAEYVAFGIFFSVVAWLQALWGLAVAVAPSQRFVFAGLVGNALVVAVWVLSRTSGLPIGPEAGTPEPVAFLDGLSTVLELAIIAVGAVLLTRRQPRPFHRGRRTVLAVVGLTIALGILTTTAIAGGSHHRGHSEGSGDGDHHVAP